MYEGDDPCLGRAHSDLYMRGTGYGIRSVWYAWELSYITFHFLFSLRVLRPQPVSLHVFGVVCTVLYLVAA